MSYLGTTLFNPTISGVATADTTTGALTAATTGVIGGTAPASNFFMRFATSTIGATDKIISAIMTVYSTAVGAGAVPDVMLYGSDFPSGVVRYGLPNNNTLAPFRVPIGVILSSSAGATDVGYLNVPSRFINRGTSAVSDFELRPFDSGSKTTYTVGATNTRTIAGGTAAGSGVTGGSTSGAAIISNLEGGGLPTVANNRPALLVYFYNDDVRKVGTVSGTANTLIDSGLALVVNEYVGAKLSIIGGIGIGYVGTVVSNDATTFTVTPDFPITPTSATIYSVQLPIPDPCVTATGAEDYLAFDIETTCGKAVKGSVIVDLTGSSLDTAAETIPSRSLRKERCAPAKMAVGRAGAGGGFSFEVTPEKWTKLLRGFFTRYNTVDANNHSDDGVADLLSGTATDGVAPATAPYTHTFLPATSDNLSFFTFVQKDAPFSRSIFPGCMLDSFSISASLDSIVSSSISVMPRDYYSIDKNAAGGSDDENILGAGAGYDTNQPLSFVGGEVAFNDVIEKECIQSVDISISNNSGENRGVRRNRNVKNHHAGKFTATVSFSMYFQNLDIMRKFLGISHADFPMAAERSIQFDKVDIKFAGPLGEASQEFIFRFPKLNYQVVRRNISDGPIMLDVTGMATVDAASFGSLILFVKNSETKTFFSPSTDAITAALPEGKPL